MDEILLVLPGSKEQTRLPKGWRPLPDAEPLTLIGPEEDLRLTLLIVPCGETLEDTARQAWKRGDPDFQYPILRKAELPSSEGWEKLAQIVYNIPAAEGQSALAIIRTLEGSGYVMLIRGSRAAMSRRMAQASEILVAWKPTGLKHEDLSKQPQQTWANSQSEQLGDFVRNAMDKLGIPGVSIAVVQKGRVVYAEGFGLRKIDGPERVHSGTRFMIGSSTKPLTTLMLAILIDRGVFRWNTPVTQLLPEFALADEEMTRRLEMRHTVCACTGMPRRDADILFRYRGVTAEQRLADMRTMRPTTGFGETFQYSNLLVAAGGFAAAAAFDREQGLNAAYRRAMHDLVFEPLGMANSFVTYDEGHAGDAASPHALDMDEQCALIDPDMERFADPAAPAGSIWSTAEDMAKYLLVELSGGNGPKGGRLLSKETLRSRWRGGIRINDKLEYGLGLLHGNEQGLDVISHGGNTLGFTSDLFFFPMQDLGVVALTNLRVANAFLGALKQRIFEILFGAEPKAAEWVESIQKSHQEAAKGRRERVKTDTPSVRWIEEFVGVYRSDELGRAEITKNGDQFWVEFEAWRSELGSEVQANGARMLVLVSPPWSGSFQFQTNVATGELILDTGQYKYTFKRGGERPPVPI